MDQIWNHLARIWKELVLLVAISWAIAIVVSKMGFAKWLAWSVWVLIVILACLVPELGSLAMMFFLFFLVFREWPLHRELTYAKVRGGLGTEKDAYALLERAVVLERKGRWEEAIHFCEEVLAKFAGTRPGEDATIALKRLKDRLGSGANRAKENK